MIANNELQTREQQYPMRNFTCLVVRRLRFHDISSLCQQNLADVVARGVDPVFHVHLLNFRHNILELSLLGAATAAATQTNRTLSIQGQKKFIQCLPLILIKLHISGVLC